MRRMSGNQLSNLRRGVLALAMLAVLLGSVGAAWWYTSTVQRRNSAGARIVSRIRGDKLPGLWGEAVKTTWYLVNIEGGVRGWQADVRGRSGKEFFAGLSVLAGAKGEAMTERWLLSDDATWGRYISDETAASIASGNFDTEIRLEDDTVTVVQNRLQGLTARSPAPENYLPKGTSELAVGLVAQERADAQFKMVFNERPNVGGVVHFGTVRMTYRGHVRAQDGRQTSRVRVDFSDRPYWREYLLAEDGQIVEISDPEKSWMPASQEEVQKHFPNGPAILRRQMPRAMIPRITPQEEEERLPPSKLQVSGA